MKVYLSNSLDIGEYNGFHLLQDHIGTSFTVPWNDYDFIVKFNLYYVDAGQKYKIGTLRFLIDGEMNTREALLSRSEEGEGDIIDVTSTLDSISGVSIGIKIDYYKKLRTSLGGHRGRIEYILNKLKDASFNYQHIDKYSLFEGYESTIMREGPTVQSILHKGYSIAVGTYSRKDRVCFSIKSNDYNIEPVEFDFNNSKDIGRTNINLIIGENGSGKTQVLSTLSDLVSGLKDSNEQLPFFHKLIVSAYSPFENFLTRNELLDKIDESKGVAENDDDDYIERRNLSVNKYSYIGFKNNEGIFDLNWPKHVSISSIINIMELDWDDYWLNDRKSRFKILLETLSLSINFDDIAVKCHDKNNEYYFKFKEENALGYRSHEKLFLREEGLIFLKDDEPLNLSSGQEIFSYMIPAIVAEIEEESLLILDEPELYLHPTLEVGIINMLKSLLTRTKSYAVIATHSSLLAREVSKDGIAILRRKPKGNTTFSRPNMQTYGETLEVIIGEAFDDYYYPKPFQNEIDKLKSNSNVDDFLSKYSKYLGDEAIVYALSSKSDDEEIEIRGR
ncbi:AAA family ATPase [Vibrio splendidus]|uniref:AAA family ATPase n=1 Tax=Vibrio splendidus TaxID=29497 RepID=UPI00076AD704|nr:AAA family ATPase [Vibrio splendidus]